ncbi:hypothetical protein [Lutibacter sp.]|uniref:hypothetical protein n=1 Tax=Lutibacter sp. TaxID=1925666 RepID=UPI0027341142|nr:hypothetical protein [Lutibacter sp.]MDP3312668.1 hypothetical protein [Lutibacter sp.]
MNTIITPIICLPTSINFFDRLFQSKTSPYAFENKDVFSLSNFKMRVLKLVNKKRIMKSAANQLFLPPFPQRYARDFCCGCILYIVF